MNGGGCEGLQRIISRHGKTQDLSITGNENVSHCFRQSFSQDDEEQEDLNEYGFQTPPQQRGYEHSSNISKENDAYRYLLRMKPQNYVHGDNSDDDVIYSVQYYPKMFVAEDPENLPPCMPELR